MKLDKLTYQLRKLVYNNNDNNYDNLCGAVTGHTATRAPRQTNNYLVPFVNIKFYNYHSMVSYGNGCLHTDVIVNSRFLQRPQKRSRGNQLIHRHLTRTNSIESDGYGG